MPSGHAHAGLGSTRPLAGAGRLPLPPRQEGAGAGRQFGTMFAASRMLFAPLATFSLLQGRVNLAEASIFPCQVGDMPYHRTLA